MVITKSQYMISRQCPKALWLYQNKPNVMQDNQASSDIIENGKMVGELARMLFPEGVLVEYTGDLLSAVDHTRKFIAEGVNTIYEAAFINDDSFAMCDILRRTGDGWEIYEVKSSTELKQEYLEDVSFQYFLLSNIGIDVARVYVVYINNEYERVGALELEKLFVVQDVSSTVKAISMSVPEQVHIIKTLLSDAIEPDIAIGEHCGKPYECLCKSYCWSHVPEYSIFDIAGMRTQMKFNLYKQGIVVLNDIVENGIKLSSYAAQLQVRAELNNEIILDKHEIRRFLSTLTFPLYFLDFESYQQPIPLFDHLRPYEQIPFQYSLHSISNLGGELVHKEFLAKEGQDPRRELAERLVSDIPSNVCVLAYNMVFEKMIIGNLAAMYEDLRDHLMSIYNNMKDLMVPFQKKHYYLKEMKGSYSIKYVLPALFPNNEELSYKKLNIQNGGAAMHAFAYLHTKEQNTKLQIRKNLLEYCHLDTLAMVRIWEKLIRIIA